MILESGSSLYLYASCAKTYDISEEDLVPGVKIVTLPILAREMLLRETVTL